MRIFWFIISGLAGGLIGGMGMGGGTLLIPILTIFIGIEQHFAQAINLISFIPMAIICLIIHSKNRLLEIKKTWLIALIAALGSVGGAFLSANINSVVLSKILGVFLIVLAVFQFVMFCFKNQKKDK